MRRLAATITLAILAVAAGAAWARWMLPHEEPPPLHDERALWPAAVLIAATAVANGLPVYTRNPDDFAGIDALTVVIVGDAS